MTQSLGALAQLRQFCSHPQSVRWCFLKQDDDTAPISRYQGLQARLFAVAMDFVHGLHVLRVHVDRYMFSIFRIYLMAIMAAGLRQWRQRCQGCAQRDVAQAGQFSWIAAGWGAAGQLSHFSVRCPEHPCRSIRVFTRTGFLIYVLCLHLLRTLLPVRLRARADTWCSVFRMFDIGCTCGCKGV